MPQHQRHLSAPEMSSKSTVQKGHSGGLKPRDTAARLAPLWSRSPPDSCTLSKKRSNRGGVYLQSLLHILGPVLLGRKAAHMCRSLKKNTVSGCRPQTCDPTVPRKGRTRNNTVEPRRGLKCTVGHLQSPRWKCLPFPRYARPANPTRRFGRIKMVTSGPSQHLQRQRTHRRLRPPNCRSVARVRARKKARRMLPLQRLNLLRTK